MENAMTVEDVSRLALNGHGQYRDKTREDLERAVLTDQRKLDAVVHVLGIEDSEDDPSEVCRQIIDENEKLRSALSLLWAEVVASGNAAATDFGWPKACAATLDALRLPATMPNLG